MLASNPFSTRFTQPGRLVALDDGGLPIDIPGLVKRLPCGGKVAAIVGPHGSGKSTLLVHLGEAVRRCGRPVAVVRMRSWLDAGAALAALARQPRGGLLCLDSWECLGPVARWGVRAAAWCAGCGLLVTSHTAAGLPVLVQRRPTPAVLDCLVRQLPGHEEWYGDRIAAADLEGAFARHGGNIREVLYDLYDRFEAGRHDRATVRL